MNSPFPLATDQWTLYPESDGEPIGENTLQFRWIVTLQGNLEIRFAGEPLTFVAGDLFWYPVEGQPKIRSAPDVMVVIGRPKGDRLSYLQWNEGHIPPQVVWEVRSPSDTEPVLADKFSFFQRYGVEEYYLFDPATNVCRGWLRRGERLEEIESLVGWISPRLGIRFEPAGESFELFYPDGRRFLTFLELGQRAMAEQERADQEAERADAESLRADAAEKLARMEAERADQLAAKLRAFGVDPSS